jgi:hypothetical protein
LKILYNDIFSIEKAYFLCPVKNWMFYWVRISTKVIENNNANDNFNISKHGKGRTLKWNVKVLELAYLWNGRKL